VPTGHRRSPGIRGDQLRAARAHRFSACPTRPTDELGRALRASSLGCHAHLVATDLLRLFAPAFLPRSLTRAAGRGVPRMLGRGAARHALVLDPLALYMEPPARLLAELQPLFTATDGPSKRRRCAVGAASSWPSDAHVLTPRSNLLQLEASVLAIDLDCAHVKHWLWHASIALRRTLAHPNPFGGRGRGEGGSGGFGYCPREMLGTLLRPPEPPEPPEPPPTIAPRHDIGLASGLAPCEWAYQPASHAFRGHHRLVSLPSEGVSSLYVTCMHSLVHQAFARAWSSAHDTLYASRRCGCGQRVRVLLPPRDESGALLLSNHDGRAVMLELLRRLPGLFLDASAPLTLLWSTWASMNDDTSRWVRQRATSRTVPPHVIAMVERRQHGPDGGGGGGDGTIVLPQRLSPLGHSELARLRAAAAEPRARAAPLIYPCGYAGAEEAWIPHVLLAQCSVEVVCLTDLLRDVATGKHARGAAAIVPGAVLVLQSQQLEAARLLASLYRVPLSSMVLIHISDGNIWQARVATTASLYASFRHAFRQYWLPDEARSLDGAAARGDVSWIPIGENPQWVRLMPELASGERVRPPASSRALFISFLGSTDKSDRAPRIAAVNRALATVRVRSLGEGSTATSTARVYQHRVGNVACYGSDCADGEYVRQTLQSALCLQLPGSSVESNRLYESIEGGCVPLIVRRFGPGEAAVGTVPDSGEEGRALVVAAFAPLSNVSGGEPPPFVVVDHEDELAEALKPYAASASALDALQARMLQWWVRAKRHYADALGHAVCPGQSHPWRRTTII
jgi:hypothetical protein